MRLGRKIAGAALAAVLGTLIVNPTSAAAAAPVRNDSKNETVIFVHGWNNRENTDCAANWKPAETLLRNKTRWTGKFVTWGYYRGDKHCDVKYNGTQETSIDTLARSLANYIYNTYSRHNKSVDLVAHSMGGLIIRRAVSGTQRRDSGFPPYLYVEDAVTLSSPHAGTRVALLCSKLQCRQMQSGSDFQDRMKRQAMNPQSKFGTDWSTLGSEKDGVVSEGSAIAMSSGHKYTYLANANLGHTEMRTNASAATTFDVKWRHATGPRSGIDRNARSPLYIMANALYYWRVW